MTSGKRSSSSGPASACFGFAWLPPNYLELQGILPTCQPGGGASRRRRAGAAATAKSPNQGAPRIDDPGAEHGRPAAIRMDRATELTADALDAWAHQRGIERRSVRTQSSRRGAWERTWSLRPEHSWVPIRSYNPRRYLVFFGSIPAAIRIAMASCRGCSASRPRREQTGE